MEIRNLINKEKLICDNIITITLLLSFGVLFLFFRLIIFMSIVIYPICSLFIYGVYHLYRGIFKEKVPKKIIYKLIQGIAYLWFSCFILILIFSYPHVTMSYAVIFLSIPVIFIGLAAILKGLLVEVYSIRYRRINILIGLGTLIITLIVLYYIELNSLISLSTLFLLLILNGISRSGLYLSEYGLSLKNLKNLKYVFYIMDNLIIVNLQEEYRESL